MVWVVEVVSFFGVEWGRGCMFGGQGSRGGRVAEVIGWSVWSVCQGGRLKGWLGFGLCWTKLSADVSIGDPSTKALHLNFALLASPEPNLLISVVFTVEILQNEASPF